MRCAPPLREGGLAATGRSNSHAQLPSYRYGTGNDRTVFRVFHKILPHTPLPCSGRKPGNLYTSLAAPRWLAYCLSSCRVVGDTPPRALPPGARLLERRCSVFVYCPVLKFTGKVFISTPEDTGPAHTQMQIQLRFQKHLDPLTSAILDQPPASQAKFHFTHQRRVPQADSRQCPQRASSPTSPS